MKNLINCTSSDFDFFSEQKTQNMLRDGMKILVHSYSRAVIGVLKFASERGIRISVIVTES